jgi:hypothetical protein
MGPWKRSSELEVLSSLIFETMEGMTLNGTSHEFKKDLECYQAFINALQ